MRIALISYEMPPATGGGGIGTYLVNLIPMLTGAGHEVEVFAGAGAGEEGGTEESGGAAVHRFGRTPEAFLGRLGVKVRERHERNPFDVAEAPEYRSQSGPVRESVPELPMVVKLHTPGSVIHRLNHVPYPFRLRVRRIAGALRRLRWPEPIPKLSLNSGEEDAEAFWTRHADLISAPSRAIWEQLDRDWGLPGDRRFDVPLPYQPSAELLAEPILRETRTILFLGRLETRKGIVELVNALPGVLRSRPEVRVRFVGRALPAPDGRGTFTEWVERKLRRYAGQVELKGPVTAEDVPGVLGAADIAVFPSRWESFGYVCLEAMAAGCGVVGSRHGGMAELLDGGSCGVLVDPFDREDLAAGISGLLDDAGRRQRLGGAARQRVLDVYAPSALIGRYEEGYRRAIDRHREAGTMSHRPAAGQHAG